MTIRESDDPYKNEFIKLGQVNIRPDEHIHVSFTVDGVQVSASPLAEQGEESDSTIAVEDYETEEGVRARRYLKFPKHVRESSHTVIEYYHDHENLQKGVKAAVVAGAVVVGSLFALRLKRGRG